MLLSISIQNFILIDHLHLEFSPGLNIITGASGAGKSIILDALDLIIGDKINGKIPRPNYEKQIVLAAEFSFNLETQEIISEQKLSEESQKNNHKHNQEQDSPIQKFNPLDFIDFTNNHNNDKPLIFIIRRIIGQDNRSRFYINDLPCTSQQVKKLSSSLTQIVRQNSQHSILTSDKQRQFLDDFANNSNQLNVIRSAFKKWQEAIVKVTTLKEEKKYGGREGGYLCYLVDEISKISPEPLEEERLIEKRKDMIASQDTKLAIHKALDLLENEQAGILTQLQEVERILGKYRGFFTNIDTNSNIKMSTNFSTANNILDALENNYLEITNITSELHNLDRHHHSTSSDSLEDIEARLSVIRTATRKYGVENSSDLLNLLKESQEYLDKIEQLDNTINKAEKAVSSYRQQYLQLAQILSTRREATAPNLTMAIKKELTDMEMSHMDFMVQIQQLSEERWQSDGINQVSFVVRSAGNSFDAITKVASGGEISRLLLAIHLVITQKQTYETIIFDEIDIGIGGAIASTIGNKLSSLANDIQVISITHQPQVAVYSDHHILASKTNGMSHIAVLDDTSIEKEIGRMLSGRELNESSLSAARAMIQDAIKNKKR